jgi:hypothetical protein
MALCGEELCGHDFLSCIKRKQEKSTPDVSRNEDFEVDGGKQLRYQVTLSLQAKCTYIGSVHVKSVFVVMCQVT